MEQAHKRNLSDVQRECPGCPALILLTEFIQALKVPLLRGIEAFEEANQQWN